MANLIDIGKCKITIEASDGTTIQICGYVSRLESFYKYISVADMGGAETKIPASEYPDVTLDINSAKIDVVGDKSNIFSFKEKRALRKIDG